MLEFRVLGPLRIRADHGEGDAGARGPDQRGGDQRGEDRPGDIVIAGRKPRTLLAALLLARGEVLSDERLTALLWGQRPPATLSAQLYTYVSRLRGRLGPSVPLVRESVGYRLDTAGARVDADEFDRLADAGHRELRAGRPDRAAPLLRSALALWRGPALGDVTDHLRAAETPRLEEARMVALENRIEAELALGEHLRLVSELRGLVARHPLRERLRAQWMMALYRCERQAEALAAYQEGRRLLVDELGVDPGPSLTAAHRAVLTGGHA